ncbi:MAG: hypothetical protein QOE68_2055 [Thermoanaerobaculia bacterium]|nr:hypothetical protein [Thermoanaerobaculia bacterium]
MSSRGSRATATLSNGTDLLSTVSDAEVTFAATRCSHLNCAVTGTPMSSFVSVMSNSATGRGTLINCVARETSFPRSSYPIAANSLGTIADPKSIVARHGGCCSTATGRFSSRMRTVWTPGATCNSTRCGPDINPRKSERKTTWEDTAADYASERGVLQKRL